VKRLLVAQTDGNPLFLEECVRTLVDTGALVGDPEDYRLQRAVESLEIPATVQAVVAARIDRLPPPLRWLLQEASVFGERVPLPLLTAVTDLAEDAVGRGLEELQRADFLDELPGPEPEYRFKHSLSHEVAYETLLHEHRRLLHGRIVEVLETLHPERVAEQAESLAHHAIRAEAWEKAVGHLRRAGHRALARLSPREAVAYFEQALIALGHLPSSRSRQAEAVEIQLELRAALTPLGESVRILAALREAERLAEALGDEHLLGRVLAFLGQYFINTGDADNALKSGERAHTIAGQTHDFELAVISCLTLGAAWRALGEYRRAAGYLRENVDGLVGDLRRRTFGLAGAAAVLSRGHLAWSLAELGEFGEAVARGREAVPLADSVGDAYSICHAALGLGGTLIRQGRFQEAIPILERGAALGNQVPLLLAPLAADLGIAHARCGRAGQGLAMATQAVESATAMGRLGRLALLINHLAEILLLAGLPDEARARAARALELARQKGERGNQVYALRVNADVAASADPPDVAAAETHFAAALRLAEELGMRPLRGRCHLGLAMLYGRIGRAADGEPHLEAAANLFSALGMHYWLEQTRAARAAR
jgi:tetratricopeptide (TPR) repeat protein